MSQTTSPLEESIPVEEGNVYSDARTGDQFELIYFDDNVYIVQERDGSHRFGRVADFRDNVRAGRYSLESEVNQFAQTNDSDSTGEEIELESLDGIGETGATNLIEAGIATDDDVRRASDEEILSVSWVGEKGLESLRNAV